MPAAEDGEKARQKPSVREIRRSYLERYRSAREDDPFFVSRAVEQIIACLAELTTATRWLDVRKAILGQKPAEELVCYCLGDLSELQVAFQLAFCLLIANHFAIPPERRLVFDPLHTEKDHQLLKLCGCTPLSRNENALRKVRCRTLFYMPFAPFPLTDNVVRANWEALDQVMIIGNPLRWVVDHRWRDNGHDEQTEEQTAQQSDKKAAYTSRAPCVEAALELAVCTELTLWNADLSTWTLAEADAVAAREEAEQLQREKDEGNGERDEGGGDADEGEGKALPTEAAKRGWARHALSATLATFGPPPAGWPASAPPPAAASRSRL